MQILIELVAGGTERRVMMFFMANCFMLAGCGEDPIVNTRGDKEQRSASIDRVKESHPPDRLGSSDEAMPVLLYADIYGLADLADSEGIARRFKARVHGLIGEEITAEAAHVTELKGERERQRRLEQINELANKLDRRLCPPWNPQTPVKARHAAH